MVLSNAQWFANPGAAIEIDYSCRFNRADSAYMYQTPSGTASSNRLSTISVWVKRTGIGVQQAIINQRRSSDTCDAVLLYFMTNDTLKLQMENKPSGSCAMFCERATTQVFRDVGSWYHIMVGWDSNQTDDTCASMYINGEQVTAFATKTNFSSAADIEWLHTSNAIAIGRSQNAANYADLYMSQFAVIDGSKLTAASFGETNSTTGQWIPKDITGLTYGNEGFLLAFQDSSALGDDTSGNSNDFTTSGLAAADQMTDSPTDNFCLWNVVGQGTSTGGSNYSTLSNGNLVATASGSDYNWSFGTIKPSSGKWYWEITLTTDNGSNWVGVAQDLLTDTAAGDDSGFGSVNGFGYRDSNGNKINDSGTSSSYGATYTAGDVIGVAMDLDNGKIWFSKDGSYQDSGDPAAGSDAAFETLSGSYAPCIQQSSASAVFTANFGQSSFSTAAPTGFSALSTANLPDPTIADPSAYFQTTLYTGNGSTQSVDQSGNKSFEPDLVWIKNRDATDSNILTDSVRGVTKVISSDATTAETTDADTLTAFESNGFALGDDDKVNTNTEKYVAWQWLESATSGFDIVSFTGNATARTISHSLGVIPEFIIVKNLADTDNWAVYHAGNTAAPATDYLILNENSTTTDDATIWNDTAPTSSVFSVGTSALTNGNTEAMIAYVFASVEGFSKFSSYTGTADADGPFINCGFRPDWVMIKEADTSARDWIIQDAVRNPYNVANLQLLANSNAAEATTFYSQSAEIDIVSNGFKVRSSTVRVSENDAKYVYAAFAHAPFKTANAR